MASTSVKMENDDDRIDRRKAHEVLRLHCRENCQGVLITSLHVHDLSCNSAAHKTTSVSLETDATFKVVAAVYRKVQKHL
jgi:hypothetical protein